MSRQGPLMFVALDACDPAIARRLASAGRLPTLARLFERASSCDVRNPYGLFVGALWMSFATGRRADRHHFHCWDEIDVASYTRRLTEPPGGNEPTFWRALSDTGREVAIVDVPHSKADVPLNGLQVVEWGCHDRHFGFHTWPPQRARDIDGALGLHPIFGADAYSKREFAPDDYIHRDGLLRSVDEEVALFNGLQRGVRAKRDLNKAILAERKRDLFVAVFGESHAIGHQQWHLHDTSHPRHRDDIVRAMGGDPLPRIYAELDAALSDMLSTATDDTTVLVHLSHGMGPHHDGCHLLDEVLHRLDLFDETAEGRGPKPSLKRVLRRFPAGLQRRFVALALPLWRRRPNAVPSPCPEFVEPGDRARQRFFAEPNNFVMGGVRLNLAGREPQGIVQAQDVDRMCRQLRDDLLALVNVDTGGPVVRDVVRADRWYRRTSTDTIPDLFVEWERSAPIETVWSTKTGLVHGPYTNWRTGDHRPDGLLLAFGPDIPEAAHLPALSVEDLGPSIAAHFGVRLDDVDGASAGWLGRPSH